MRTEARSATTDPPRTGRARLVGVRAFAAGWRLLQCASKNDLTALRQNGGTRVAWYAASTSASPPSAATRSFATPKAVLRLAYGSLEPGAESMSTMTGATAGGCPVQ